MYKWFIF